MLLRLDASRDDRRKGATTLFAALSVLDGRAIARCPHRHRHGRGLKFRRQRDRETPKRKTFHLIDLAAGAMVSGSTTLEDTGWALFRMMLRTASGERRTCAERVQLANSRVLFNPAPVT